MMKNLVEKYELGIGVDQIQLKNANPFAGSGLFQRSQSAEQEKARMINEAKASAKGFMLPRV